MGWACGICQIWKYVNWMLAYICVRISLIKRASSGPPCCFGVVRLVLSIHDNCQLCSIAHIAYPRHGLTSLRSATD